jgi:LmbE family N-acetylglucosaminyl deacetylase
VRVLVISAHPDDEVIGAGGTLARHVAEGADVFWCIVTQGYSPPWPADVVATARRQVEKVRQVLGIRQTFFCGFPTVKLNTIPHGELSSSLQKIVTEVRPEVVYLPPGSDINRDHRIVFDATLVATRPFPDSPVRRVLCYEIGPTGRYGSTTFTPNVFVDIEPYLEKKLEAMACYDTELKDFPHPRSLEGLRLIAQERGMSVGLKAAECFQLIREIQRASSIERRASSARRSSFVTRHSADA